MLSKTTSVLTTGTLGGLFIDKLINKKVFSSDKLKQIQTLETTILGIATAQYGITIGMPYKRLQRWRYFDWIITTPLLLKTFHTLAQEKGYSGSFNAALFANLVMIIAGYYAEFLADTEQKRKIWYAIGVVALVFVLYHVNQWDSYLKEQGVDTGKLSTFFYLGWTIYGANFLTPNDELRQTGFNVLDLFNKGVYTLELDRVLAQF